MCVLTTHGDSSRCSQVSVLSVHVVGTTAGVIAEPDTKVLHLQRGLLVDLQPASPGSQINVPLTPRDFFFNSPFTGMHCGCLNSL